MTPAGDVDVLVADAVGRLLKRRKCNGAAAKRYYAKNAAAQMARQTMWRNANKEHVNARRRELRRLRDTLPTRRLGVSRNGVPDVLPA